MKANQQFKQDKKVSRHFNKFRFLVPKVRNPARRVLGGLLSELPEKVKFSEPATHKLKIDIRVLYKNFKQLYNFVADNLASPWMKAADNFYTAAADNLCDFLKTRIAREVPKDWVSAVQTVPIFSENVVMVIAGELADPEEVAESFKAEFAHTFKRSKPVFTKTDAYVSDLIRKRLEGMALKDITKDYIRENNLEFDAASDDDWQAREQLEDKIKHSMALLTSYPIVKAGRDCRPSQVPVPVWFELLANDQALEPRVSV